MAGIPKHEYSNPAVPCSVKTHLAKFNIELGCTFSLEIYLSYYF